METGKEGEVGVALWQCQSQCSVEVIYLILGYS